MIGLWSQAGGSAEYRPVGFWWASAPAEQWPGEEEIRRSIRKDWREPWGDRRQQLVYIGQDLPKAEMLEALRDCLLDDREMALGPEGWKERLEDPFAKMDRRGSTGRIVMPTYVYETIPTRHGEKLRRFEFQQSMKDKALVRHPDTGQPIPPDPSPAASGSMKIRSAPSGRNRSVHRTAARNAAIDRGAPRCRNARIDCPGLKMPSAVRPRLYVKALVDGGEQLVKAGEHHGVR